MASVPLTKASGVGDVPDLISEETPPEVMYELTSDPSLINVVAHPEGVQQVVELQQSPDPDASVTSVPAPANNTGDSGIAIPISESVAGEPTNATLDVPTTVENDSSQTTNNLNPKLSDIVVKPDEEAKETEEKGNTQELSIADDNPKAEMSPTQDELNPPINITPPVDEEEEFEKDYLADLPNIGSPSTKREVNFVVPVCQKCPTSAVDASSSSVTGSIPSSGIPVAKSSSMKTRSRSRSNSNSRQSQSSDHSKSPGRVVEVHDRKAPVHLKSPDGKPVSPYLCKVFPIHEPIKKTGCPFPLNDDQNKLLDGELLKALERERHSLMNSMKEYFNTHNIGSPSTSSSQKPSSSTAATGSLQSTGKLFYRPQNYARKDTLMSWLMKDKRPQPSEDENENWDPLSNVFRQARSTQVSQEPSLTTFLSTSRATNVPSDKNLHLVGQGQGQDEKEKDSVRSAAQKMYQSLQTLQKAVLLSDLFCFRNGKTSSTVLGVSLSEPKFQQFLESESEMDILVNVKNLLAHAKDNIDQYLSSVSGADIVAGHESGLTKIETADKANVIVKKAEMKTAENDEQPKPISKSSNGITNDNNDTVSITCPSCLSKAKSTETEGDAAYSDRMLPTVHTFSEEKRNVALSRYSKTDNNGWSQMVQLVMSNGFTHQVKFSSSSTNSSTGGTLHGVLTAHSEYLGEPSYLNLDSLLNTIHRCGVHMNTRITCSSVWTRQCKRYLLEVVENYLRAGYRPSTNLSWWRFMLMERKLKRFNMFAGIMKNISEELIKSVNKLHFCMQKSLELLHKQLKEPTLPGFTEQSIKDEEEDQRNKGFYGFSEINENGVDSSVERLYETLRRNELKTEEDKEEETNKQDETLPTPSTIETLLKIVSIANKDIQDTNQLGTTFVSKLKMPNRKSRQVLRFMNVTLGYMGKSKDVELGALAAMFLSAVDKLVVFEELMCEQKVDIRAKVHLICMKIIHKLYELRGLLNMQKSWSSNLAKNSFMRIKELNEIERLRKLKKKDKYISDKMDMLRGSDKSLRVVAGILEG